jgi:hypothetical protein
LLNLRPCQGNCDILTCQHCLKQERVHARHECEVYSQKKFYHKKYKQIPFIGNYLFSFKDSCYQSNYFPREKRREHFLMKLPVELFTYVLSPYI